MGGLPGGLLNGRGGSPDTGNLLGRKASGVTGGVVFGGAGFDGGVSIGRGGTNPSLSTDLLGSGKTENDYIVSGYVFLCVVHLPIKQIDLSFSRFTVLINYD